MNNNASPPPRIKGRVGSVDEGEFKGTFFFEIAMFDFYGEKQVGEPMTFGPYKNEPEARAEMMKAVRLACDTIETAVDGKPSVRFMDMKNGGVMRNWEEH